MRFDPAFKLMVVVAIFSTGCSSGSDGLPPCPPECAPATSSIVVDAGLEKLVFEGDTVTLSGSATHSENLPLQFQWSQMTGPRVNIVSADSPTASFVAPFLAVRDTFELLLFRLTVTASDGVSGFDSVDINVQGAVGFSALDHQRGKPHPLASDLDDLPATLQSQVEIEPNDSISLAAALLFPPHPVTERNVASVVGNIGSLTSSELFIEDRADVYIISSPVPGVFDFKLQQRSSLVTAIEGMPGWHLSLLDRDGNALAYARVDGNLGQSFTTYLDAGVPYYVSISAADFAAGGEYKLSIIENCVDRTLQTWWCTASCCRTGPGRRDVP